MTKLQLHFHNPLRFAFFFIALFALCSTAALALVADVQKLGEVPITEIGASAEWLPAKTILMHTPGQELFLGIIHPDAALYEKPFSINGAANEHQEYIRLLEKNGAVVFTVRDALLRGVLDKNGNVIEGDALDRLREFAADFLTIDTSALPEQERTAQEAYKEKTLRALDPQELIEIILLRPTVHLQKTDFNTGFEATYSEAPLMNLYFLRDQMITTEKGVVISKMNSQQRAAETRVIKFALSKLGVTPILEISGEGRLEGGDFLPADGYALLGQGLRTNAEAVRQLLDGGAIGAKYFVVVKDAWQDQEQMHLDTFFNIIDSDLAVLEKTRVNAKEGDERFLTVDVYDKKDGEYVKIKADAPFVKFVRETLGMKIIPVTSEDQLRYGVNFLTIRGRKILGVDGVSEQYKQTLANNGVDATWMDFSNLSSGYGAAHCSTQVLHRAAITALK
ncbi:arginine deiminase family protein [Thiorhodovibrio frisius]|uniref:arginine deiminase n=1 Tax=Thiorhodovibrio frisius TaxID=631362 RepID=H8YXA0_9GAMM|nr:arginine deiminase family protein [Thiorhodovibrio frisius]EIC23076.1 arginine deiminase [Thiorhodovibrio frisius]WPL22659.1 Arginine deiminase [Thiorhodovibrio frisius]